MQVGIRFHGLLSLGWVLIAVVMAAVVMFQVSWLLGAVYLIGCAVGLLGIVYAYCAKCPCRTHCAHVILGKLALALMDRQPGPYSGAEVAVVILALLWLLGLPQVWLWQTPVLFVAFWVLNTIAVIQIRLAVCRGCDNGYCPLRAGS
jgi:hypothetical protein